MANTNGFDPVAWSINGGAHAGSLLRSLAYAATSGEEGVITPDDCKVTQLGTAGPQVQIATGAVAVLNRYDSIVDQVYLANARAVSKLDVTPTTGVARSDMVVLRIKDPEYQSVTIPAGQAPSFQYVIPEIIQNVPGSAETAAELNLGYPAVALARLDLPPNTTNITTSMIKEKRKLARPRTKVDQQTSIPFAAQGLYGTTWTAWATFANRNVAIPKWAKQVIFEVHLGGVKSWPGANWGGLRAKLGTGAFAATTREIAYDVNTPAANNYDRLSLLVADTITIADQIRGTTQPFAMEGYRNASATNVIELDTMSSLSTKLTFLESVA